MIRISLCMIVKDEEDVIARCLDSIKDTVDEIIMVDTGSVDKTKEIISRYTDKIYDFKWVDDFSKARNYSFSKATGDYILWLDADDVVLPEDAEKLRKLKENTTIDVDMYIMPYIHQSDEMGNPKVIIEYARMVKREKNYQWIGPIHEIIMQEGKIEHMDIRVFHMKNKVNDPNRNINIFRKMIAEGQTLDQRQEYCYAKELYYVGENQKAIDEFEKYIERYIPDQYQLYKMFLYPAFLELSDCYKKVGNLQKELETLLKVLQYEVPEGECCSRIGIHFFEERKYKLAIYWFTLATRSEKMAENEWHSSREYYDYIPYIYLGICYYELQDYEKAIQYNEMAGKIKPNDKTYLENKLIYEQNKI